MESTIRIERYADQGRCVGHIDGRVVRAIRIAGRTGPCRIGRAA